MFSINQFTKSYLSTMVFVNRAYSSLELFNNEEILLHKRCEELIIEILPIATFLKYFDIPDRQIRCKYFSGNQNFDAKITIQGGWVESGFLKSRYFLEVTSAICPKDFLKRESLARYGSVFGGTDIHRVGSRKKGNDKIISNAMAEDGEATVNNAIDWVIERIKAKSVKNYPKHCILLVNVFPDRPLSFREWLEVRDKVKNLYLLLEPVKQIV